MVISIARIENAFLTKIKVGFWAVFAQKNGPLGRGPLNLPWSRGQGGDLTTTKGKEKTFWEEAMSGRVTKAA
jgi:hypothetical protein